MIDLPEWRLLIEAVLKNEKNAHISTYCQLASVDSNGHPRVRTMVWRGFDNADHGLLMCTDAESAKRYEFDQNNRAEIAWYFVGARQQFRLSGCVECLGAETDELDCRERIWSLLTDNAKRSFKDNLLLSSKTDNQQSSALNDRVPEAFMVIKFQPLTVRKLDLRSEPHGQFSWRLDHGNWVEED